MWARSLEGVEEKRAPTGGGVQGLGRFFYLGPLGFSSIIDFFGDFFSRISYLGFDWLRYIRFSSKCGKLKIENY